MTTRFLLDTHIVARWLLDPQRLSREQARILHEAVRHREPVAISAITLLELAMLFSGGAVKIKLSMDELFGELEASPAFHILPLTSDIAKEVYYLGATLHDPAGRVIVATARFHGLRLLTSDQRIIQSKTVSTVE